MKESLWPKLTLACVFALATLAAGLVLIRWLAPSLVSTAKPIDLELVRVDEEVSPFLDSVFRVEDYDVEHRLLQDPHLGVRMRPLMGATARRGPHDLLGFRNTAIPNHADVITLGDSQTYGNNASIDENWPGHLNQLLDSRLEVDVSLYNMAMGAWGPIQYLEAFGKAVVFQPRIVILAFYTGNDSVSAYSYAQRSEKWRRLGLGPNLDASTTELERDEGEEWPVEFSDQVKVVFTPGRRMISNQDHPIVHAGYQVMANVARLMAASAEERGFHIIFTIIPTKELAYAERVRREIAKPDPSFSSLMLREGENFARLAAQLQDIDSASYVDLLAPLQSAALGHVPLYRSDEDGHPVSAGYKVIAWTLAGHIDRELSDVIAGDWERVRYPKPLVFD